MRSKLRITSRSNSKCDTTTAPDKAAATVIAKTYD